MARPFRVRRAPLYALATAACAGLMAAGPTLAHAQQRPQLVAIYKSGTQQYFIDQANGFKSKAADLGADAKVVNVELDANRAINEVNNAIAGGANGVAITVPDQKIGPAVSQAAQTAKIPLIATDDSIKDAEGNPVPFVGFDGTDMGTKVGQEAATLLNQSGWLQDGSKTVGILSVEVQTLSVCNDRTDAAKQQVQSMAGVTPDQIIPVPYTGETDNALQSAGPVVTAHPDVTNWVVFACNDEGVKGTLRALDAAGVTPDNIIGVGLGAYEACPEWKAGIPTGFKAALYISGTDVGQAAAQTLVDNITKGVPLPPKTVAKTTMVDPTNYSESGLKC
jgi:L-arabinose transport system substrate-binding protein